jgi:hypothetical protein
MAKTKKKVKKVKKIKISRMAKRRADENSRLWRNKADKMFSKIILSQGKCLKCGRTEFLDTAHIIPRENIATRWDLTNAIPLCKKHHKFCGKEENFSFHKNPVVFFIWAMDNHPEIIENARENLKKQISETHKQAFERLEKIATKIKIKEEDEKNRMIKDELV